MFALLVAAIGVPRIVILGGTGRIGSAAVAHLLASCKSPLVVSIAGRDATRGATVLAEIQEMVSSDDFAVTSSGATGHDLNFIQLDRKDDRSLQAAITGADAVVHTAGPYAGEEPDVLRASIDAGISCYVDLSDPVDYLRAAKALDGQARQAGTLALCASGAFPGLSNVLAMECASRLGDGEAVQDVDFNYFTAGLGGSGEINLLITNEGFGDPVPVYRDGKYSPQMDAGGGLRRVQFFLSDEDASKELVGERSVWNWPFPEGWSVAKQLEIRGSSSVGMGTAPELWNTIMGLMVEVVPREWWRDRKFSAGLAQFSKPLVALTDPFVGETHVRGRL